MTRRRLLLAGLALSVCCLGLPSSATAVDSPEGLSIVAVAPGPADAGSTTGRWTVYLDGVIDAGAAGRLADLVGRESIAEAVVHFNSPGGSLLAAMALGRLLRERGFDSNVGTRTAADPRVAAAGVCYSACPIAFAGGRQRRLPAGSLLGIHRAENRVPVPDETAFQQLVAQQLGEYLAEMGVDPELRELMRRVPHRAIRVLTTGEARVLGLVNAR